MVVSCPTVPAVNLGPLEEQCGSLISGHLFFETGFQVAQDGFELIIQLRLALNFDPPPPPSTALITLVLIPVHSLE